MMKESRQQKSKKTIGQKLYTRWCFIDGEIRFFVVFYNTSMKKKYEDHRFMDGLIERVALEHSL